MRYIKSAGLFIVTLIGAGCALKPQTVSLNPQVNVVTSTIGSGQRVKVSVVDARTSQSLGRRDDDDKNAAADITLADELADVVERELRKGLQQKGFEVTEGADADSALTVAIDALQYAKSDATWTDGVRIDSAVSVTANNHQAELEKTFRLSNEERVVMTPSAEKNAQWINDALSKALEKLINDPELLGFLAAKP